MKSQTRRAKLFEIILLAFLGVIMHTSQLILAVLPNIELVSLLIIVTTCIFGAKALCSVYIFVFCQILHYGIREWNIGYLYGWALLCLAVLLTKKLSGKEFYAILSAIFGLIFDLFCSVPYFITGGISGGISYLLKGIPFDIAHCIGNLVLTYLLFEPVKSVLETAINKYKNS